MRIKIIFEKIEYSISVHDLQRKVNSYIHKLLGNNNKYHDTFSDYSVSSLMRGKFEAESKSYRFPLGAYIVVTSNNEDFINKLTSNIWFTDFDDKIKIKTVEVINENIVTGNNYFTTLTPILLVDNSERDKRRFITLEDKEEFEKVLNERSVKKLKHLNPDINLRNFNISVMDGNYNKLLPIYIKDVFNLASQCNLMITGNKKTIDNLYNMGIGQSTGSGFGSIYATNNYGVYNSF